MVSGTPAIPYNAEADLAAHAAKEKVRPRCRGCRTAACLRLLFMAGGRGLPRRLECSQAVPIRRTTLTHPSCLRSRPSHRLRAQAWEGFASYCQGKVAELQALAAEQADHKLHRWYRRSRLWSRFPGLYEELHHKVRGTWDRELWASYIGYKARTVPLPWNPAHGSVSEEKRVAIYGEVSAATGLSPVELGYAPKAPEESK